MTCCSCASRVIIILFNVIFLIVGLALAVGGGLLRWNSQPLVILIEEKMSSQTSPDQMKVAMQGLLEWLAPFALGIFISGIIIIVLCIIGLFGAICNSRLILVIYLILHGLLVIAEIIVVIIYATRPTLMLEPAKGLLWQTAINYVSENSTDKDSVMMNVMMLSLNCCGVDNGTDFDNAPNFQRERTYNGVTFTLRYPVPCCKFDSSSQPQGGCPVSFTSANSNIAYGCWTAVTNNVDNYGHILLYISIAVIALQVILEIAAIVAICTEK
ncbi:hypothetical protein P879_04138 [Paragonimus westermani]|uniref:Tetraspanin n=1 Tax=Paragonimus westermani TaxID=34504 RepID=A0A8T0DMV6_9TREM|nr:hypothetical protein P879_04138 [Paragonimus westermani]